MIVLERPSIKVLRALVLSASLAMVFQQVEATEVMSPYIEVACALRDADAIKAPAEVSADYSGIVVRHSPDLKLEDVMQVLGYCSQGTEQITPFFRKLAARWLEAPGYLEVYQLSFVEQYGQHFWIQRWGQEDPEATSRAGFFQVEDWLVSWQYGPLEQLNFP